MVQQVKSLLGTFTSYIEVLSPVAPLMINSSLWAPTTHLEGLEFLSPGFLLSLLAFFSVSLKLKKKKRNKE